jgi:hypothetical protein
MEIIEDRYGRGSTSARGGNSTITKATPAGPAVVPPINGGVFVVGFPPGGTNLKDAT